MNLRKLVGPKLLRDGFIRQAAVERPEVEALTAEFRAAYVAARLIRIGGAGDGGHLIPDDLDGVRHCFSPGVSDIADFEEHLAREYGIKSFLADASVDTPPVTNPLFEFDKEFPGAHNDTTVMTLGRWITDKLGDATGDDLILQMDIEGAEFEVLIESSVEVLGKFRSMVIEFHGMERIFERHSPPLIKAVFRKIHSRFAIVHLHANNCTALAECRGLKIAPVFEVTYQRRDRLAQVATGGGLSLPHPQDHANVPENPDIGMPDIWWRG
ncbi:Methyltransferase FkbM domain-containing protein [Roseovarius lutimaris]|uniref:Methyltransferase FkbM domain-containing protein n=1 Tax=Roseovarius lutimaris TaxID=1005928 RepID=A0A1I4YJU3_9RHOB|nr:hypothetical protein [Roseovarius lutimaris]SFN38292.1 Methyltransferase FkbM domain-containing protein [Roseovarius lutimaris]